MKSIIALTISSIFLFNPAYPSQRPLKNKPLTGTALEQEIEKASSMVFENAYLIGVVGAWTKQAAQLAMQVSRELGVLKGKVDEELKTSKEPYLLSALFGQLLFEVDQYETGETYLESARIGLEKALLDHPKNTEILEVYGDVLYSLNKVKEAFVVWYKILENDPNHLNALNNIAAENGDHHDLQIAFDTFTKIEKLNPAVPVYYENMAAIYSSRRHECRLYTDVKDEAEAFAKADGYYLKAISLYPDKKDIKRLSTLRMMALDRFNRKVVVVPGKAEFPKEVIKDAIELWTDILSQSAFSQILYQDAKISLARWILINGEKERGCTLLKEEEFLEGKIRNFQIRLLDYYCKKD